MDLTALLKRVPLFRGLDDDELAPFRRRGHLRTLPPDVLVFGEGDPGTSLYVVVQGLVRVFVGADAHSGREVLLALVGPGGYFGELSMIDGGRRSASVMTVERTRLLVITRGAFRECLAGRPDVAYRVITGLATRVRHLTDNVRDLATKDVRRRVAAALVRLAEPVGRGWLISDRPTHQDVADMIGASREMTGRAIRELIDAGHVHVCGRRMVIRPSISSADLAQ